MPEGDTIFRSADVLRRHLVGGEILEAWSQPRPGLVRVPRLDRLVGRRVASVETRSPSPFATGLLFDYGMVRIESAGQDQALSNINYLRYPVRIKGDDVDATPDPRNFWGYPWQESP